MGTEPDRPHHWDKSNDRSFKSYGGKGCWSVLDVLFMALAAIAAVVVHHRR